MTEDQSSATYDERKTLDREELVASLREAGFKAVGGHRYLMLEAARHLSSESETGTPVAWVVAVEEQGAMRVYGPQYRSRESAEQDAALPRARGQRAEVWECYVQR